MLTITGDLVTPSGLIPSGSLVIDDTGHIAEITSCRTSPPRDADIEATGQWVLPGFLDLHVHGGGGADFMHGTPGAVERVLQTHARFGTTGLLATTLTASREDTDAALKAVRLVQEAGNTTAGARLLGVHLEGPYLCRARRGAQPEAYVRPPDVEEFLHWVSLSGNLVRQITLAPELDGAEVLIRTARSYHINVSLGHTDANAEQTTAAAEWGANQATHLFNAMPPLHHRRPGAAGAALALSEIITEIIADGVHLHPQIVRLALAAKGPHGAVLITDAIEGTAMPDGVYKLGGFPVTVADGTASFTDGTLAGSVLTMNRAFLNALRFADLSPQIAAGYASTNAARQLGLSDRLGSLEVGKEADLVVLSPDTAEVSCTMVAGRVVYRC
jgi:N-acetylglucosamine-6-phosphate deacetylase